MFMTLVKGTLYYDPETGAVVKGLGKKQCALFPPGASAVDGGFLLDRPAHEVAGAINEFIEGNYDEEQEEDEEGAEGD